MDPGPGDVEVDDVRTGQRVGLLNGSPQRAGSVAGHRFTNTVTGGGVGAVARRIDDECAAQGKGDHVREFRRVAGRIGRRCYDLVAERKTKGPDSAKENNTYKVRRRDHPGEDTAGKKLLSLAGAVGFVKRYAIRADSGEVERPAELF